MRVLIIGGTGNISSAISERLLENGAELTLFKRSNSLPPNLKRAQVITGDRSDARDFAQKISTAGTFDCVIDMVCYDPLDAAAAVEHFSGRIAQMIFCSTVDVYTKSPSRYPVTESRESLGARPSFSYGFKKLECERIFWQAHEDGAFQLTVMRPAFTYNESWSPGIHSFGGQTYHLDRLRKGRPFILHGDGMSLIVATHRDDVAVPFVNAIGNEYAFGKAFNITGDELMTYNQMWQTIARVLDAPPPNVINIPTDVLAQLAAKESEMCKENFQYNNIFDNSQAKTVLHYRYTVRFEEGARRSLEYLLRHDAIDNSDKYGFYDDVVSRWHALLASSGIEMPLRSLFS